MISLTAEFSIWWNYYQHDPQEFRSWVRNDIQSLHYCSFVRSSRYLWDYRFTFHGTKIKLWVIQISSKFNLFCIVSLFNYMSLPKRIPSHSFHSSFKSFLHSEVLWLFSALWFHISNLWSANQHYLSAWDGIPGS